MSKLPAEKYLLVEMREIIKHFPGVMANDNTHLEVKTGEIHALLGENGAGKSTLMNILSGLYQPDSGLIYVKGKKQDFRSPRDAIRAGIGMVHQHFSLVDVFTASENVMIGLDQPGVMLELSEVEKALTDMGDRYGLHVDPKAKIWQLSVGEQQRVEILKLLYRDAELLILDEPTAVLTPQEADELAKILRQMTATGKSVLYISHKLQEVLNVADRITVLRDGKNVATVDAAAVSKEELTRLMIGKNVLPMPKKKEKETQGPVMLQIRDLWVKGDRGYDAVKDLSLELCGGEILGIAGVSGNGQQELAESIAGFRKIDQGNVYLDQKEVTHQSPKKIIEQGLSLIPENCKEMGLIPQLDLYENAILKNYYQPPISKNGFLDPKAVREYSRDLVEKFSIRATELDEPVWKLSGGNLQRLLLGREIAGTPRVLVAANPTRGLDVQAANEIRKLLLEQRREGAAILLISEDLDEVMTISDRVAVIYNGQIIGEVDSEDANAEDLGLMMMGSKIDRD